MVGFEKERKNKSYAARVALMISRRDANKKCTFLHKLFIKCVQFVTFV